MSLGQLAEIINWSKSHLARIEKAESPVPEGLSQKLDAAFNTGGRFGRLYDLAKKEIFAGKYRDVLDIEAKASGIEEYAAATVPGLLQTEDYARWALRTGRPHAGPQEIESLLQARMGRQKRLNSSTGPRSWFILDEAVLCRPMGSTETMTAQLHSIIQTAASRSWITVQILPFAAGPHPEMGGTLVIYTLSGGQQLAYDEGARTGVVISDPNDVGDRRDSYDLLRAQALSPRDSEAMIRTALKGYGRAD